MALIAALSLVVAACQPAEEEAAPEEEAPAGDEEVDDEEGAEEEEPEPAEDDEESPEDDEESPEDDEAVDYEELSLTFAYITPTTFPYHDGAERFKELVEERSDGQVAVELFPDAQLGAERDINEGILEGSIDIGIGAGALASFAPIMNLPQLPFLIKNQDHMHAIIESDVGDGLAERIEEADFKVLDWFSTGDSAIQTVDVPVESPEDLEGVRIRIIENPALVDALEALGANPTPMPYPEIYTGLQQGVIEGSHVDWGSVVSLRLYELIGYSTSPEVAFLAEPRPVIMSMDFWEGLDSNTQDLLQDAMAEAAEYEREVFLDEMGNAIDEAQENGVELTEIDEDAFVERLEPVWEDWAEELDAVDLLEGVQELRPED